MNNKPQFYHTFPNFDWKFYTSNYQDLHHLNNERLQDYHPLPKWRINKASI